MKEKLNVEILVEPNAEKKHLAGALHQHSKLSQSP